MATLIETNETSLPLELTVNQLGTGGVTGLSPTVAIRNVSLGSPPSYLDWSSMTFKTSGWSTKYQIMTEIERGHYQQILNLSSLSLPVSTKLVSEYHVNNGSDVVGDDSDTFILVNTLQETTLLRKVATNKLIEVSGSPGTLALYDDNDTSVIMTWSLRDETGGAISPTTGTPAQRSKGSP